MKLTSKITFLLTFFFACVCSSAAETPYSEMARSVPATCPGDDATTNTAGLAEGREWRVAEARFGIVESKDGGALFFLRDSTVVPGKPGTMFGWIVRVEGDVGEGLLLEERFTMPKAPATWGAQPETKISPDGKVSVACHRGSAYSRIFSNMWEAAEGDPVGAHRIRIRLDGVPAAQFDFEVR